MLNSKQRAFLRSQAQSLDTIFQIGKGGITEEICNQIFNALEARELVKLTVLENSGEDPRAVLDNLCEALGAEGVSCVGRKIVLYRESKDKKTIELPKK